MIQQTDIFGNTVGVSDQVAMKRDAHFSPCGQYRYSLTRQWSEEPGITFVGLNPSTANAQVDDPTIKRVIGFAKSHGYGQITMLNLFSIISPYPEALLNSSDPIGPFGNDILLHAKEAKVPVVFAWGVFKQAKERRLEVSRWFPEAMCLGVTKGGHPWHPLFVPGDRRFTPFPGYPEL